jgi:hypothetical protein
MNADLLGRNLMRVTPLPEPLRKLARQFQDVGGELRLLCVSCDADEPLSDVAVHRRAAILAMNSLQQDFVREAAQANARLQAEYEQNPLGGSLPTRVRSHLQSWVGRLTGTGKSMDQRLDPLTVTPFQIAIDHERAKSMAGTPMDSEEFLKGSEEQGLAYALLEQPHGLQLAMPEQKKLFDHLVRGLLGEQGILTIYGWPTDWSNYFDAGHEWWGSFLWSVARAERRDILVIAISTTD